MTEFLNDNSHVFENPHLLTDGPQPRLSVVMVEWVSVSVSTEVSVWLLDNGSRVVENTIEPIVTHLVWMVPEERGGRLEVGRLLTLDMSMIPTLCTISDPYVSKTRSGLRGHNPSTRSPLLSLLRACGGLEEELGPL